MEGGKNHSTNRIVGDDLRTNGFADASAGGSRTRGNKSAFYVKMRGFGGHKPTLVVTNPADTLRGVQSVVRAIAPKGGQFPGRPQRCENLF